MLARIDWLLLALSAAPDGWMSSAQTQKAMFLFAQQAGDALAGGYYAFGPGRHGPFDAAIDRDLDCLASRDLVRVERLGSRAVWHLVVMPKGAEAAQRLRHAADRELRQRLAQLVTWVKRQSFSDLDRKFRTLYPEYAKGNGRLRRMSRDIATGAASAFDLFQQPAVRDTHPWYRDWLALHSDFETTGRNLKRAMGLADVQ